MQTSVVNRPPYPVDVPRAAFGCRPHASRITRGASRIAHDAPRAAHHAATRRRRAFSTAAIAFAT
ncbi:hypothetical protein A8H31_08015 [Burkholderia thailandensis]|nr:hypothetical protein A8H31_08015 [Burkholderia thailandensis]KVG17215.1 hypothetical protein WJ25_21215 [Burkholderia thailandensis]KVG21166.1 hypothetical protein WJ28_25575 [Burkholderia thailandensis]NOK45488.1 hypothetical protein [Burkholderia thailandensis]NOK56942.1 hypothetical protein [Burkholderia thailandensis]